MMPIFEAFYILVLDEIRAQPHLENELRWLESTLGISEINLSSPKLGRLRNRPRIFFCTKFRK